MNKLVLFATLICASTASAQTVTVHLDAPPRVVLEEDEYQRWAPVCTAPCDRMLDVRGVYRIGGRDVKHQRIDITPLPGKSALDIHVQPGSRAVNILGIVLTPLGGGATVAGLFIALFNFGRERGWEIASDSVAAGGAVMAFAGLIMVAISQTTVTF